jgi:hypothetical protein
MASNGSFLLDDMTKGCLYFLVAIALFVVPTSLPAQQVNKEGWPVPDLSGLTPYSISIRVTDGVEKVVEKFLTRDGGQVARISGNGKIFGYVVDKDLEPPIDFVLIDPDGSGRFTQKFNSEALYYIPEWVSR